MRSSLVVVLLALVAAPAAANAAPFAGRWNGVFHGGRGDQQVLLICRPGAGGALGGLFYMSGDLVGPLENGTVSGDSLRFTVMNFSFHAHREGDQMALVLRIANGNTHEMALRFGSPDTSALVQSPAAAAAALARITVPWDQVPDSVLAAHRLAADVAVGPSDALRAGTLFLVGGGPSQADLNAEFVRLAGGPKARIVVIPTAGVEPGQDADALRQGDAWAKTLGVGHVTVLHTADRKQADDGTFVNPLRDATGVWLAGGEAGRILVSYLGTRTERELMAVLARGGVIGGTSAGALVWGSECQTFGATTDASPYRMGDANALILDDPRSVCFGALRQVVVAPHFTEFRMQPALAKTIAAKPRLLGIGIDEATAFEVHGSVGTVLGRGHVTVLSGAAAGDTTRKALSAGTRYDLARGSMR